MDSKKEDFEEWKEKQYMLTFDMTFCDFYEGCKYGKSCHRALTPKRHETIQEQWGKGDPILSHFAARPECFEKRNK